MLFFLIYKEVFVLVFVWGGRGGLLACVIFSFSLGSNDIIIPDAQVQVLITGDEDLSDKNQKKEIYSERAVTEASRSEEKEPLQKDITGSGTESSAYCFILTF